MSRRKYPLLLPARAAKTDPKPDTRKRLAVALPDPLKAWLADYSKTTGLTQAAIIRTLLKMLRAGRIPFQAKP